MSVKAAARMEERTTGKPSREEVNAFKQMDVRVETCECVS